MNKIAWVKKSCRFAIKAAFCKEVSEIVFSEVCAALKQHQVKLAALPQQPGVALKTEETVDDIERLIDASRISNQIQNGTHFTQYRDSLIYEHPNQITPEELRQMESEFKDPHGALAESVENAVRRSLVAADPKMQGRLMGRDPKATQAVRRVTHDIIADIWNKINKALDVMGKKSTAPAGRSAPVQRPSPVMRPVPAAR